MPSNDMSLPPTPQPAYAENKNKPSEHKVTLNKHEFKAYSDNNIAAHNGYLNSPARSKKKNKWLYIIYT